MISERCDYEKFSGELTDRLVELRVNELIEFEERAKGQRPSSIARNMAKAKGQKRYFGRPCKYGHNGERYTRTSDCCECRRLDFLERSNANRETYNAYARRCYHALPVEKLALARKRMGEWGRAWKKANPDKTKTNKKEYRLANMDRWRSYVRNRRARLQGVPGTHDHNDVAKLRAEQHDQCAHCKIDLCGAGEVDHKTPLAKGGSNWPHNLQLLCGLCNRRKHAKDPVEHARAIGLLPQSQPPGANTMNAHSTSLFQPAANNTAFLKAGITGEPGAGKSITSGLLAIGLVKYLRSLNIPGADKPVGFFDTEKGSDWLIPLFEESGVPLVVAKERTFAKTLEAFKYMKENCSVGIFDSVTHPWDELKASFMKQKQRSYLQIDEIVYLKGVWKQFTDEYMNSPFHCIICGRAGDETEQWVDDNGKRQFEKVGVKMATEKSTAYEPSLSILMERDQDLRSKLVTHFATVTKDRSTLLDGKQFTFASYDNDGQRLPTETLVRQVFAAFKPHIDRLNLGGRHMGVNIVGDSTGILTPERRDWQPVQRKIVLGEIQDLLVLHAGGQTAADKQRRINLLKTHLHAGWVEIEETMPLIDLRAGYDSLHVELEGVASRYGTAIAKDAESLEINDSLPNAFAPLAAAVAAVTETIAPATDTFDESKWLAELTRVFGECVDFVSFGEKQQTLMAANKTKVSQPSWKKAVKLATACMSRLMEEPGQASGILADSTG